MRLSRFFHDQYEALYANSFLRIFYRHLTPKRVMNLLLVKLQKQFRSPFMKGYPYMVLIDPGNICNLHCPLCSTGAATSGRNKGWLTFETFKRTLDALKETVFYVGLYNWGEPFLNKDLFKMIRYARDQNVGTMLSSHMNTLSDAAIDEIVSSGLEYMKLSLDGASPETYAKYRVGGDFHRALENVRKLVQKKKEKKSRFPILEWQFLVMKHNEHELEKARQMSKEIGTDLFTSGGVYLLKSPYNGTYDQKQAEDWFPKNEKYRYPFGASYLHKGPCYWLWEGVIVNWDGRVTPCCYIDNAVTDFGDLNKDTFRAIWNNDAYTGSRKLFNLRYRSDWKDVHTICRSCRIFDNPSLPPITKK